jgi:hypothetical protein
MRTTLTLDPDVAAEIGRRRRLHGTTLKDEVNGLLRTGLRASDETAERGQPYRLPAFHMGESLIPLDDVQGALEIAEGDDYFRR